MNKATRAQLVTIQNELKEHRSSIEEILEAEREKFDNMSDKAQESARGEKMSDHITILEQLCSYLDDIDSDLDTLTSED